MYEYSLPTSDTSSTIGRSPSPAAGAVAGVSASSSDGLPAAARAAALRSFLLAFDGLWCLGFSSLDWPLLGDCCAWCCPSERRALPGACAARRFRLRRFGDESGNDAWLFSLPVVLLEATLR